MAARPQPDSALLQRLSEMAVTNDILSGEADLSQVLYRIAARTKEITSADYAAISTFDGHGSLNRFVFVGINDESARRLGVPPTGRGLLGELANYERPLRLDNLTVHSLFTGWPEGHPVMQAFLGVPIRAGGRTIGSLYMTRLAGAEPFSGDDELSAAILALQAAVSVSAAIARERAGRLLLLEERERIAHDLHDGTIQSLYALGLEYDVFSRRPDIPDELRLALQGGLERINQLIADIRSYITLLEAEAPAHEPEISRDLAYVVRQMVPKGIVTVVNVTAPSLPDLSMRESEDLLYIAREALSNAVRHSGASRIGVDLRQVGEVIALTVQDNGRGFDPATVRIGLGTVTIRTRTARLGGSLSVVAIPSMGVTVRVEIPRPAAEEEQP